MTEADLYPPECVSSEDFNQHISQPSKGRASDDEVEEFRRQFFSLIFGAGVFAACLLLGCFSLFIYVLIQLIF